MATAQQVLDALNGVTFASGALGTAQVSNTAVYGTNDVGGLTDVYASLTDVSTGYVSVAYVTQVAGSGTQVTGVHYGFTAGDATHFATFGTITLNQGFPGAVNPTHTYYVHGFSEHGLLLSQSASLSLDEVNGSTFGPNGTTFQIFSMDDLGLGPSSLLANQPATDSGVYGTKVPDGVGITHYVYTYNGDHIHTKYGNATWDNNPNPPSYPLNFSNDANNFIIADVPPCFAEGTHLLTLRGEVAVEDLVEGDEAVLASGGSRPVIWVGSRRIRVSAYPHPAEVNPVRVRAGAFGAGAPVRDLLLSPGHAVHVDGVLVPVGRLANGATIVQEEVETVRYFHVELDAHDVVLAEGLTCESYLDDGNREVFANSPEHVALYGRLDPQDREKACAPVVEAGEALAAIQAKLLARAGELGWVRGQLSDLALLADGVALEPLHAANGRTWWSVPACQSLVLASSAGRPAELVSGAGDLRQLGVAVAEVRVDGATLDLSGAAFGAGFHVVEHLGEAAWRWTDGQAHLHLAGPALLEVAVRMTAYSWSRQPVTLRLVANAN